MHLGRNLKIEKPPIKTNTEGLIIFLGVHFLWARDGLEEQKDPQARLEIYGVAVRVSCRRQGCLS